MNLPWAVWAVGCLVVAGVFTLVWPRQAALPGAGGPRFLILRWGHAAVWALLGLSFLVRSAAAAPANLLALLALAVYLAFLSTLLRKQG